MNRRAIAVMAKSPDPGTVKTRLSTRLTFSEAAVLHQAFLRDSVLLASNVPDCGVIVVCARDEDTTQIERLLPDPVSVLSQSAPGLTAGMYDAMRYCLGSGAESVVVIGADTPALPVAYLEAAFSELEDGTSDVVLGPSEDGGYYLLGVREIRRDLLDGIDWGTERVFAQTCDRARQAALQVSVLDNWYDIDTPRDLDRLAGDLGRDGRLAAPATRLTLRTLRQAGARIPESPAPWTVLSQRIAESPWRSFAVDTVRTHTNQRMDYRYLIAPDAVWVVPVTGDGQLVLVRQYRHPIRDWLLEVPAGIIDGGSPLSAADRELREEVGGVARELRPIGWFYPSAGAITFRAHVFLALGVKLGEMDHEPSELIHRTTIPAGVAFDMAMRGEIAEAQSALAILRCESAIRDWLAVEGKPDAESSPFD